VEKLLPGFSHHAVCHDRAVAVLRVPLETQQADRPTLRERDRLAQVEQGFRLIHMGKKDALEAFEVSATGRVSPALRGAEPAQMAVTDAGIGQVSGELILREAFLARDWRGAYVENQLDPCLLERADEGVDGPAL
jgi:hypothetical protein